MSSVNDGRQLYAQRHPNTPDEPPQPSEAATGVDAGRRAYQRHRAGYTSGVRWATPVDDTAPNVTFGDADARLDQLHTTLTRIVNTPPPGNVPDDAA